VGESGEDHVFQRRRLLRHGLADMRMGVAKQVDPPRRHRVEVALAVGIFQPAALAADDRNQRQPFVVRHLRARMPQDLEIAGGEGGVAGHESSQAV
jgi:hypothetical protein